MLASAPKVGGRYVLDDGRSDDLAGTTPGGKGIEDNDLVVLYCGVELGLAVSHYHTLASASRHFQASF